jgi:hypothetical protein
MHSIVHAHACMRVRVRVHVRVRVRVHVRVRVRVHVRVRVRVHSIVRGQCLFGERVLFIGTCTLLFSFGERNL